MARRREAEKREILPDPKFNDILVARFINSLLKKEEEPGRAGAVYRA
jgi:small subunit ribosomal protein S7